MPYLSILGLEITATDGYEEEPVVGANVGVQTFAFVYVVCACLGLIVLFLVPKLCAHNCIREGKSKMIPVVVTPFITLFLQREDGRYKNRYAEYYTVNNALSGPYFDSLRNRFDQKLC